MFQQNLGPLETRIKSLSPSLTMESFELMNLMLEMLKLQQQQLLSQEKRIKELEIQLSKDSTNSHKPPSSDGTKKGSVGDRRSGKKRKPGGQAGHKGHKLEMVSHPDKIESHVPPHCSGCGHDLSKGEIIGVQKAQVFDIPPLSLSVCEHQVETRKCSCCGELSSSSLPSGLSYGTQYGSGVRALMTYLHSYQLIPAARCSEFFEDLFGHPISAGTCINIQQNAYDGLESFENQLKTNILQSHQLGADETGIRIMGKRYWLHTISSAYHTLLFPHQKRGRDAIDAYGVLPKYEGILTHDRYSTYFGLMAQHSLCNVHLGRDLEAVIQQTGGESWATKLQKLLLEMLQATKKAQHDGKKSLEARQLDNFKKRYRKYLNIAFALHPLPEKIPGKRGRPKKGFVRNLIEDFQNYEEEILRFAHDFRTPFDNNQSERDIRMCKVKMKISGCFRAWKGAYAFARIRAYIITAKKQGIRPFEVLNDLFGQKLLVKELVQV